MREKAWEEKRKNNKGNTPSATRKMRRMRAALTLIGLLAVMLFLAACGAQSQSAATTEAPATTAAAETATPAASTESTDTGLRSITHLKGTSEIPMKPERVVALSAAYIDHMLTLGEKPVGVNNEERYGGDYLPYLADELEGVAVVGSADTPNLEAILQLNPDVILVESRTAETSYEQLNKIAPTVVLGNEWKDYDEDPDFWTEDLLKIAEMYDKTEVAQSKIDELKQKTAEVKTLVEKSEHRKLAYVRVREKLFQIYGQNGHPTNALLYRDLGFEPSAITPVEHREDLSLEGLADLDANRLILEVDPNGGDFLEQAQKSSIWKDVPAVQQEQVYETDSFWLFKGWGVLGRTEILEDIRKLVE
ncbi:iron-siderophore ABC transporter substrate-binding protein [Saccharibacillus sacchari]|uniref:ABC transporter substrate-binding protein n=1 Tax=Saccharibacillus sacchari TaxID=456493 RepID=UPI0004B935EC|nr:iron-siderophore ABC transporter substrate-binding protein [Saccharibacillus sacchari]